MSHSVVTPRIVAIFVFLLALLSVCLPLRVVGQQAERSRLFLAIPDEFPDIEARSVLVREPGRTVILLRKDDATPEVVSMTLMVLRRVRRDALAPGQGEMIPIVNFAITRPMSDAYRRRLGEALDRLQRRPTLEVGNLGPGRWIRFRPGRG